MSDPIPPSSAVEGPPGPESFFGRSSWTQRVTLLALFSIGLAIRMIDFTEPPLDFHPARQLRGALIARGLYYQWLPGADPETRDRAVALGEFFVAQEPPLLNALVGVTYLLAGGEDLSVARAYSIAFWLLGGAVLYRLTRRVVGEDGAIVGLAYYLVIPLGVYVSRSFQPDSLMVLLLVGSLAAALRWQKERTWTWAILTGLAIGAVALVKARPALIAAPMGVAAVLAVEPWRKAIRDRQVWVMTALAAIPAGVYYLGTIGAETAGFLEEYAAGAWGLLLDPQFYFRWMIMVDRVALLGFAAVGLAGVWLLPRPGREVVVGLWIGYGLYGLALPYTIVTHNYYSIGLVPIVAVSLAPVAGLLLKATAQRSTLSQAVTLLALAGLVVYRSWFTRSTLLDTDYSSEPQGWIAMGKAMPPDGSIIGLTHDYGLRLAYYGWRHVSPWPVGSDFEMEQTLGRAGTTPGQAEIEERMEGYRYFLVTLFGELDAQPTLKAFLESRPIAAQGGGFVLYDLGPSNP